MTSYASRILSKTAARWVVGARASRSLVIPKGRGLGLSSSTAFGCRTNDALQVALAAPTRRYFSENRGLPPGLMSTEDTPFDPKEHTKASEVERLDVSPPDKLDFEMVEFILEATDIFLKKGIHRKRVTMLAENKSLTVVERWQKMMEIFFTTQVYVIHNFGYSSNEQGFYHYNAHLQQYLSTLNEDKEDERRIALHFRCIRRDTWRRLVAETFDLDLNTIPEITIAEARSHMHRVSERMVSGDILLLVQKKATRIFDNDEAVQNVKRHTAVQEIIVEDVYKPLLPELGFVVEDDEDGGKAYASFQCAVADFEGDPLMGEYSNAAMSKIWEVAGLKVEEILKSGESPKRTP